MRHLIFRAKRLLDRQWITGSLVNIGSYVGISENKACYEEVDPSTLCQWCGMMDVKGLMVFDRDYVKASDTKDGKSMLWRIEWYDNGFMAVPEEAADGDDRHVVAVRDLYNVKLNGNMIDNRR